MQHNDDLNTFYAKIFRRSFFSSLAKGKSLEDAFVGFENILSEYPNFTLRDVFISYFDKLKNNYRNEYVYKSAIVNKIIFGRHSPRTSSTSIELPVNNSIVDVAIFNGCSTAYEIKSEYDTPKRLSTQTIDYLDVFEKVYIVTHPKFAEKYCDLNIPYVGVISLTMKDTLKVEKEAISNFDNIKHDKIFNILRKNEFISIIEHYTDEKIHLPNGLVYKYCREIFNTMPLKLANDYFLQAMKKRANNKDFIDYIYSLPACLRALGYATPLSKKQKDYVVNLMDSKIKSC
ncbi:sce7726 family protein [Providencia hangzhouensis]|uniref:sce7726 family protein n=1 Tax=Providencia hangzhouensis TaxID=3031799 RepID=UPI0024AB0618